MGEVVVTVPPDAGTSYGWGHWAILREPPEKTVVFDLADLKSIDPLFLLRMRGFIDWHTSRGFEVRVDGPRNKTVRKFLGLMNLAENLPDGCQCDIEPAGKLPPKNSILIPIRRIRTQIESDQLDDELAELYTAQLGLFAEAFTRTVSEMCDNATTHGKSEAGLTYLTAMRIERRTILAIGDLGVGIPAHMRQAFPELVEDEDAIREATKEGVTATGNPNRGIGYQYVIDGLKESAVARGELRVWSGRGRFRVEVRDGLQVRRRAWQVDGPTAGTWVRLELSEK